MYSAKAADLIQLQRRRHHELLCRHAYIDESRAAMRERPLERRLEFSRRLHRHAEHSRCVGDAREIRIGQRDAAIEEPAARISS